jgi:hypothetical protein
MNPVDYPEPELVKRLQGIPFMELAKKNVCEYKFIELVGAYELLSRFLMWDALPTWVLHSWASSGETILYRTQGSYIADKSIRDKADEIYREMSQMVLSLRAYSGYEQTKALAELWIFLKENNLIGEIKDGNS